MEGERATMEYVLIGDADEKHFQRLKEVIEQFFYLEVLQGGTLKQIKEICDDREENLRLILLTENLPVSNQQRSVLLRAYFCGFHFLMVKVRDRIGIVQERESSLSEVNLDDCRFVVP